MNWTHFIQFGLQRYKLFHLKQCVSRLFSFWAPPIKVYLMLFILFLMCLTYGVVKTVVSKGIKSCRGDDSNDSGSSCQTSRGDVYQHVGDMFTNTSGRRLPTPRGDDWRHAEEMI